MMKALVTTACVLLAISTGVSTAASRGPVLTTDGWGKVKIGASLKEVEAALGHTLTKDNSAAGNDSCIDAWVGPPDHRNPPIDFRFENGRLADILLTGPSIGTDTGIHIGDSEAKVQAAYGKQLKRTAMPYFEEKDPQHQLYYWRTPLRGLVFNIDDKSRVSGIEAGTQSIQAMEGCA